MDTSTSRDIVRLGEIVHSLVENRYDTRCGISGEIVAGHLLCYEQADEPVDCMTCLVDRPRRGESMGFMAYPWRPRP